MPTENNTPKAGQDNSSTMSPIHPPSGTDREALREKLVSIPASVTFLLTMFVLYVIFGEAIAVWREGDGSPISFFWAFLKTYAAFLLFMLSIPFLGILLGVPFIVALMSWGPYNLILLSIAFSLWYWAGAYNWGRDILLAGVIFFPLVVFRKSFFDRLQILLGKPVEFLEKTKKDGADRGLEKNYFVDETLGLVKWFQSTVSSTNGRHFYTVLTGLILTWLSVFVADVAFGPTWFTRVRPLPTHPSRFAEIAERRADETTTIESKSIKRVATRPRLGVALSGGGFRAALMHAGVLASLEDLQLSIAGLATVSGGSIIGGFYVAGGKPSDFRDAVAENRFNLKRELISIQNFPFLPCPGHIPIIEINLLWSCSHSRVDAQANLLDRVLFNGKQIRHIRRDRQVGGDWWLKPPWWLIGATDLLRGDGIAISENGIFRRAQAKPGRGLHRSELVRSPSKAQFEDLSSQQAFSEKRIAELVAVSGAFPGAFGSTSFEIAKGKKLQVVDGGITDNLGYSLLVSALEESAHEPSHGDWKLDMILVSDGGMPLSEAKDVWGHKEFIRALDLVYASSGIGVQKTNINKIWLSPQTIEIEQVSDEDFKRIPTTLLKHRGVENLKDLRKDIEQVRKIFLATSTLKDRFEESVIETVERRFFNKELEPGGKQAVDALFTLGQYLVYLNLCDISDGLKLKKLNCPAHFDSSTSPQP